MSTFDPATALARGLSLGLLLLFGAASCGAGTDCLRFSDCASGMTCAAGQCVAPPAPDPGDAANSLAEGGAGSLLDAGNGDDGSGSDAFGTGATTDDGGGFSDPAEASSNMTQGGDAPAE